MKKLTPLLVCLTLLFGSLPQMGCTSTSAAVAYRTIASVKLAVDTGMNVWADRVIDGKATPAQEAQVKAAFEKYTAAARSAAAVMRSTADPANPDLTAAADALLNLLAAFGVQGGK